MLFNDAGLCFQGSKSCFGYHSSDGPVDGQNWDLLNDAQTLENIFQQTRRQIRGPVPKNKLIVLYGKEPRHLQDRSEVITDSAPGRFICVLSGLIGQTC
jgi:hypothetical protein